MSSRSIAPARDVTTTLLLVCGAIAGPFFTAAWIVEGATRSSYDPRRHPISSLAIGTWGWTQAATFIITGCLTLAFAVALRRMLQPREASWGPWLVGAIAIGLIGAGIFVTDPLNGYPAGTPNLPVTYSVVGRLHRLFSALVFLGLPAACVAFARYFSRSGERGWTIYSRATGLAFVLMFVVTSVGFAQVAGFVSNAGLFQRITLTIGWAWLTLLAVHMLNALPSSAKRAR